MAQLAPVLLSPRSEVKFKLTTSRRVYEGGRFEFIILDGGER